MSNTHKVAEYFDERAANWLAMESNTASAIQPAVARLAGIGEHARVLDIGCGIGVMAQTYLDAGVDYVLGVDVSPEMINLAAKRWEHDTRIAFLAADAAHLKFPDSERFDAVVIYNAYPHFMEREALVQACKDALKPGGRFIVAHSTGREGINSHHDAHAAGVSIPLRAAAEESQVWEEHFAIDCIIDTPLFYAFAGKR